MTVTVEQAAEVLGISRAFAFRLAAKGELPTVRLGRRLLVPLRSLEEVLTPDVEPSTRRRRARRQREANEATAG